MVSSLGWRVCNMCKLKKGPFDLSARGNENAEAGGTPTELDYSSWSAVTLIPMVSKSDTSKRKQVEDYNETNSKWLLFDRFSLRERRMVWGKYRLRLLRQRSQRHVLCPPRVL